MTFLDGVVFVFLLGTNLELSSTMSLKRQATGNCQDQFAVCRPNQEVFTSSWFDAMFNSDGSLNVNCSAVGNQNTCEENLDDKCRDEIGWLDLRLKITFEQHACNQPEVCFSNATMKVTKVVKVRPFDENTVSTPKDTGGTNEYTVFISGRQCWKTIENTSPMLDCGMCETEQCAERILPGVPGCSKHVKFFTDMAAALMRHFQRFYSIQC